MSLALVEADLGSPLHVRVENPLHNKECPLHATNLAQCNRQIVLAWIGGKLAEQLASLILPEAMVAAQRNRSGQFAMINSPRILPPTSLRKSLGVPEGLNT